MPGGEAQETVICTGPYAYLPAFAALLKEVRDDAGHGARSLARSINYSHSQVVRATGGVTVPCWELVRAYLDGCDVGGGVLHYWWLLWSTTKFTHAELKKPDNTRPGREWFWERHAQVWREGLAGIRQPDPLLVQLRSVENLRQLGEAISVLAQRTGMESFRAIESATGIPRTTLQGWWVGKRRPTADRLDHLVLALGATRAEQREFAECLDRVGETSCSEPHYPTARRCCRDEYHKGPHITETGDEWFEDGELEAQPPGRWSGEVVTPNLIGPHW